MEVQAVDDADLFADLSEFDDPELSAKRAARRVIARAQRTRTRISVRRAKSEALLADLLPPFVEAGDSWHVISGGDIDSLSFAKHLMEHETFDRMLVSTWCMAMDDVRQLAEWLDTGSLKHLDVYTGEIFPSQYADAFALMCQAVRRHSGRVATFRNHSKVMLLQNRAFHRHLVIESSANVNTNPRTEQTTVTADAGLFWHYADFFDAVHSFNDNFTGWAPYGR
ncbi:hypothetical protein PEC18_05010 [Paucibacter sp. O1-1]|uniref:hypothetical protein n=1 Tax=Aquabacterium sp. OR-4 TaxID=2978127 RepID=UPI0021B422FD|nr:hypothetical protein [Aquabacterium sp. OR-4]MCU7370244.1 hypothetical protein [Paucibacter sp. O1-1]MDA3825229.1 hypothetical protein [Paucibacter sp. O1-1]MDT7836470.1 hypothetical protein [Aquabacterium sp. OR-4]